MSSSSLQLPPIFGGRSVASDPEGYERMRKRLEGMLKKVKVDVAANVVEAGNDVEEGIDLTSAGTEVRVEEEKVGPVLATWRARELTDPLYLKRQERIKELKEKFNKRGCLKSGSNSAVAQAKSGKKVHWGSKHETIFVIPNVDDCQKVYLLAEDLKALRRKLKKTRSERVEELRQKFSGLPSEVQVVETTSTFGKDRTNSSINGATTQRSRIPRLSIGK